ncbi:VOC family protein [Pedobacter miscanthi]|uniref:VOC family protein n=1 Tax=Pedobacter miscanthi TaxID=2259170 RepID=UPI00293067A5|nr:VOC family protein [Pedobacter miscanthi]
MKQLSVITSVIFLLVSIFLQMGNYNERKEKMKLNAGFITSKLKESKVFYSEVLGFELTFENDFYVLMHTPDGQTEISFLLPNHATQQPVFHKAYAGFGAYLTLEVADVDDFYQKLKKKNVKISFSIRDEAWGDRHFAIEDPNGLGIDIVTYKKPD